MSLGRRGGHNRHDRHDLGPLTDTPPVDGAQIDADWRSAYPRRLGELADARRRTDAWQGITRAGGIDLPGDVAGSGLPYDTDTATAEACLAHFAQFDASGTEGMFAAAVPVADDAPDVSRIVALSGRDPSWRAE